MLNRDEDELVFSQYTLMVGVVFDNFVFSTWWITHAGH